MPINAMGVVFGPAGIPRVAFHAPEIADCMLMSKSYLVTFDIRFP